MSGSTQFKEVVDVSDDRCPWCDADLAVEHTMQRAEQTCAECLTSWTYVDDAESELALAA
jgi:hypothetical protein